MNMFEYVSLVTVSPYIPTSGHCHVWCAETKYLCDPSDQDNQGAKNLA